MWPLTSQRKRRTCGPENFQSSAKTDFFNTIQPEADSEMAGMQARKGSGRCLSNQWATRTEPREIRLQPFRPSVSAIHNSRVSPPPREERWAPSEGTGHHKFASTNSPQNQNRRSNK